MSLSSQPFTQLMIWTEFLQMPALYENLALSESELAQLQGRLDSEAVNIVEQPPLHRHHPR